MAKRSELMQARAERVLEKLKDGKWARTVDVAQGLPWATLTVRQALHLLKDEGRVEVYQPIGCRAMFWRTT
jgi:Mn-dependent DtxR family transcriptional regulator